MRWVLHVVLAATTWASAVSAQEAPHARAHHSLAWDATGRRILLDGGSTPLDEGRRFEIFDDLWAFDGARWTRLTHSDGRGRSSHRLADGAEGVPVLSVGGFTGSGCLPDVFMLRGDAWQPAGALPAEPVCEAGFAYDARRATHVLFGGSRAQRVLSGETWELRGGTWQRVAVAGPAPRQSAAMAWDDRRGVIVLFGGGGAPGTRYGDTWTWDGIAWREVAATGPSPRAAPGFAWDSRRGLLLIFGGIATDGFLGDTWAWDGTQWRQVATTGPAPRAMGYMAYDPDRDRVVLFGGRAGYPDGDLGDTWEWDGSAWHEVAR